MSKLRRALLDALIIIGLVFALGPAVMAWGIMWALFLGAVFG